MAQEQQIRYGREEDEKLRPHPNPAYGHAQESPPIGPAATIGDALEGAAKDKFFKPLETKDARAIQSAEARATGVPQGVKGGPASHALSANATGQAVTLGDVLHDAKSRLPMDKIVTQRDADRVQAVERRNDPSRVVEQGGVGSNMQEAADVNKCLGYAPSGTGEDAQPRRG